MSVDPADRLHPRGEWTVVQIVDVGKNPEGIAIPQQSVEGKEFLVIAIGPKVEGLKVGDKVLMIGRYGTDYYPLPNSRNLIMIRQEHIVLVFGD